jgi:hypothetical protein
MDKSGKGVEAESIGVGTNVLGSAPIGGKSCAEEGMAATNARVLGMSGVSPVVEEVRASTRQRAWMRLLCAVFKYGWKRVLGAKRAWQGMGMGNRDR